MGWRAVLVAAGTFSGAGLIACAPPTADDLSVWEGPIEPGLGDIADSSDPELAIRRLYKELGEPQFEHDFENVENATDHLDALYPDFPHEGSGKIEARDPEEWKQWLHPETAAEIMQQFPRYHRAFGYS